MESKEDCDVESPQVGNDDTSQHEEDKPLSKRQLKKQLRTERWLERKHEKRQQERLKKKERLQKARERGDVMAPGRKRLKLNTMASSSCKVRVVVDSSFDDLMSDKDVCKFVQQIQYCYSANRRAENPVQFYVTSLEKKTKARLESIGDYAGWDVNFRQEPYEQVFEKNDVVYLSSDSKNVLETLSPDKVYVIGGLVDHNHHKGVCHKAAEEKGMYHAQLPIGKYLDLKSRKVLTVNHVFEILVKFTETGDWGAAFQTSIPQRKVITGADDEAEAETSIAECHADDSNVQLEETNEIPPSSETAGNTELTGQNAGEEGNMSKDCDKCLEPSDTHDGEKASNDTNTAASVETKLDETVTPDKIALSNESPDS